MIPQAQSPTIATTMPVGRCVSRTAESVHTHGEDMATVAHFTVSAGQQVPFVLSWYPSHDQPAHPIDAYYAVEETTR